MMKFLDGLLATLLGYVLLTLAAKAWLLRRACL
jgi:hypothetical protein